MEEEPVVTPASGSSCGGEAPPLKKYEKFYVNESFASTVHGKIGCIECHGGSNVTDMTAHVNMIRKPSNELCARCHERISANYTNSLHNTMLGQKTSVELRSHKGVFDNQLKEAWGKDCATCHADSCGQCHISRPDAVKGGLLSEHLFLKTPPAADVCVACHSHSKEGGAYLGDYGTGDIHWTKKMMDCTDCHKGELHGDGSMYENRYQVKNALSCQECHDMSQSKILQHSIHSDKLSCYVCHAGPALTCAGCHEGYDRNGTWYRTASTEYIFKIGLNPSPDTLHPYKYVTVRRAPTVVDTFAYFGLNLTNFNAVPLWKMSTLHNIQRYTAQNSDCNNCHGNVKMFLNQTDLLPADSKADQQTIVTKIPERR